MKPHSPMTIIILKISIIFEAYYSVFFQWTQVLSVLQIYRYFVMIQFPLVKADYYPLWTQFNWNDFIFILIPFSCYRLSLTPLVFVFLIIMEAWLSQTTSRFHSPNPKRKQPLGFSIKHINYKCYCRQSVTQEAHTN